MLKDPKLRKKYDLHGVRGLENKIPASSRGAPPVIQQSPATRSSFCVDPNPQTLTVKNSIPKQSIVLTSGQSAIGRSSNPNARKSYRTLHNHADPAPGVKSSIKVSDATSPPPSVDASEAEIPVQEAEPIPFPDLSAPPVTKATTKKEVLTTARKDSPVSATASVEQKKEDTTTSTLVREMIDKSQNEEEENVEANSSESDLAPIYGSAAYWRSVTQIDPLPLHNDPVLDKRARIGSVALTGPNNQKSSSSRPYGRTSSRKAASRQLTQMHSMAISHSSDQERLLSTSFQKTPSTVSGALDQSRVVCRPGNQKPSSTLSAASAQPKAADSRAAIPKKPFPLTGASDQAKELSRTVEGNNMLSTPSSPKFPTLKQKERHEVRNQSRHYTVDC